MKYLDCRNFGTETHNILHKMKMLYEDIPAQTKSDILAELGFAYLPDKNPS